MSDPFKRHPFGWRESGSSKGWLKPARTPNDSKIKSLQTENEQLKGALDSIMERLAALEGKDVGS